MFRTQDPDDPKIYLLPNLMTTGNLVCGFVAVLSIFQGILIATSKESGYDFALAKPYYERAILLIFGSCIFDLLDGRLARLGGKESPFGREFDSLADVISFGMAPSLLMAKAVLFPLDEIFDGLGWYLACIYVVCGAIRLARFNCIAAIPKKDGEKDTDFRGIPIPMAAGFISSLTFLAIYLNDKGNGNDPELGMWKYVLAGAMLGLSILMISNVRYPSFKNVGWRTKGTPLVMLIAALLLVVTVQYRYVMPVILFSAYLLYGLLVRPFLSRKVRQEIENPEEALDGSGEEMK
ncbi:CDP-diacylglycerol--serine O-phosphatidyltransferase [Haloferula rosea]|uniref:CDP-diacylglycerol--serine O-phosphatidyltransferase n=1 Tax=Haloferula rosea TaxID=490093 RepID=A0A934VEC4_9BACT|nr:CDP-diacylglycerol--serine O-phosphatidyltransferase [Haloferula rosea]MBK1825901.1 CDP-diacylglycerol--serine O-phosphatidyltransferase [Haloferula rosea]